MSDDITPHLYRLPRDPRRVVAVGLDLRQLIVIAIGGSCFASLTMVGSTLGMILGALLLLVAVALTFIAFQGRRLHEWAPTLAGFALQRARGQHVYEGAPGSGAFGEQVELPGAMYGIGLIAAGDVGVVVDKSGRGSTSYTVAFEVVAPPVLLSDAATRNAYAEAWQDLLDHAGRHDSSIAQLAFVETTAPDRSRCDWFSSNYAPAADVHSDYWRAYLAMTAEASEEPVHRMYVTVTVTDATTRQSRRAIGGTAIDVLVVEADEIATALRRLEVSVVGRLSPAGLAKVIRGGFDPAVHLSHLDIDPSVIAPTGARNAWSYYVHDGSVSCTMWISRLPSELVDSTMLAHLLLLEGINRRVAFAYQPIPAEAARRSIRAQRSADADANVDTEDPVRALQAGDTARLARDLASGATAHRFAGYVTVTATTIAELDAHVASVRRTAATMGLDLRVAHGVQDTAFSWTLPVGRGL